LASCTKFNWHPFAFISGVPPTYSSFITTSDEAFALFLVKYYRGPPLPKNEVKRKGGKAQSMKTIRKGDNDEKEKTNANDDGQDEDNDNEEDNK